MHIMHVEEIKFYEIILMYTCAAQLNNKQDDFNVCFPYSLLFLNNNFFPFEEEEEEVCRSVIVKNALLVDWINMICGTILKDCVNNKSLNSV